jgi:hypothetical protein
MYSILFISGIAIACALVGSRLQSIYIRMAVDTNLVMNTKSNRPKTNKYQVDWGTHDDTDRGNNQQRIGREQ